MSGYMDFLLEVHFDHMMKDHSFFIATLMEHDVCGVLGWHFKGNPMEVIATITLRKTSKLHHVSYDVVYNVWLHGLHHRGTV